MFINIEEETSLKRKVIALLIDNALSDPTGLTSAQLSNILNKDKDPKYKYKCGSIATVVNRLVVDGVAYIRGDMTGERGGNIYIINQKYLEWQLSLVKSENYEL